MAKNELCTASCMMADGERIVLGRTEKFGGATTIVIWDLLANEKVREMRYEGSVGLADYISYLNLSKDNRYVIAGFQNSYDRNANFIIFDLSEDSYHKVEPKLIALDACAECTAILDNHEAVTGTRNGELIVWSMRTGKVNRQIAVGAADTLGRGGLATAYGEYYFDHVEFFFQNDCAYHLTRICWCLISSESKLCGEKLYF